MSPSVIYSTNYFLSLSVIHHALRPESGQYPQTKMNPGSDSSQTQTLLFLYVMLQGRFSCDTNPWSPHLPSFPHPSNLIGAWAPGPASFLPSSEDSSSYLGSSRNWGSGGHRLCVSREQQGTMGRRKKVLRTREWTRVLCRGAEMKSGDFNE